MSPQPCSHPSVEEQGEEFFCTVCGEQVVSPPEITLGTTNPFPATPIPIAVPSNGPPPRRKAYEPEETETIVSTNFAPGRQWTSGPASGLHTRPLMVRGRYVRRSTTRGAPREIESGSDALGALRRMAQVLSLIPERVDRAIAILRGYARSVPGVMLRGSVIAGAVYAAVREEHLPISLRDVARASGSKVHLVGREYQHITRHLHLPARMVDPVLFLESHLQWLLSILPLHDVHLPASLVSFRTQTRLLDDATILIMYGQQLGILSGRNVQLYALATVVLALDAFLASDAQTVIPDEALHEVLAGRGTSTSTTEKRVGDLRRVLLPLAAHLPMRIRARRDEMAPHLHFLIQQCVPRLDPADVAVFKEYTRRAKDKTLPPSVSTAIPPVSSPAVPFNPASLFLRATKDVASLYRDTPAPPVDPPIKPVDIPYYHLRRRVVLSDGLPNNPGALGRSGPPSALSGPPAFDRVVRRRRARLLQYERALQDPPVPPEVEDPTIPLLRHLIRAGTAKDFILTNGLARLMEELQTIRRWEHMNPAEVDSRGEELTEADMPEEHLRLLLQPSTK